ncbi:hypothetical protein KCU87_g13, partial [Aureobasidium melanogenum]
MAFGLLSERRTMTSNSYYPLINSCTAISISPYVAIGGEAGVPLVLVFQHRRPPSSPMTTKACTPSRKKGWQRSRCHQ